MLQVVNPTLSLLMMAKNVENFIDDAIRALSDEHGVSWELIVVDDHSSDRTRAVALAWADKDPRIHVYTNTGIGKVQGTSFAFTKARGKYIKCIDSDDVLKTRFFRAFERLGEHDVMFHAARVVDENLATITNYFPNALWMKGTYSDVLRGLVSIPKFSWCFSREIADKIFPLPETLPFEDVWMSLIIKKYAKSPSYVPLPLYLYRQHSNQTFGGILNFSRDAVMFRARRLLLLIETLEQEQRVMEGQISSIFSPAILENRFLAGIFLLKNF